MPTSLLGKFEARESDDCVKRDLELIHVPCGARICDVEHGNTLSILAETAADHASKSQVAQ